MVTFIGRIKGSAIDVSVLIDGEQVNIEPLRLTLDQWHRLRALTRQEDGAPFWAATTGEYEETLGESAPAAAAAVPNEAEQT